MIKIETKNENKFSYDLEVHISGPKTVCCQQITTIFDDLYHTDPELFENALLLSKYAKDHT